MYLFLLALIYIAFISLGLPDSLLGRKYYRPTKQGKEARVKERLEQIEKWKQEHRQN